MRYQIVKSFSGCKSTCVIIHKAQSSNAGHLCRHERGDSSTSHKAVVSIDRRANRCENIGSDQISIARYPAFTQISPFLLESNAMATQAFIFAISIGTLYSIIALLALVYSLPILCIRRFQHRNNIFTLNVCLTTALSCLLWLPNSVSLLTGYSPTFIQAKCPWLSIVQVISDIAVPYSLVLVSFHRCSSIVYAQRSFFRDEKMDRDVFRRAMGYRHTSYRFRICYIQDT